MTVGDSVYNAITNPGILPPEAKASTSPLLMSSCDMVQALAETSTDENRLLWSVSEPFCSSSWGTTATARRELGGGVSGDRALSIEELQDSMHAWVDEEFAGQLETLYTDSWIPEAFITYFAGPPDGKHAKMVEMLVLSIHEFSTRPIVVVNFGMSAPLAWTREAFPRMILVHMAPLPPNSARSFNFNKMRAMIVARIKVGVQLDADQFVAPGVDALFGRTQEEVTEECVCAIRTSLSVTE